MLDETPHSAQDLESAMVEQMRERSDYGLRCRFNNGLLEPVNPFDPRRRRPFKREVVAVGLLLLLGLAAVVYFNLAAAG